MEHEETLDPSAPVMDNGHPVYRSRGKPQNIHDLTGLAYLTDFGSARVASEPQTDWWMPDTYRAPEVLMGVPWGCQVDIWSIGIMVGIFNPTPFTYVHSLTFRRPLNFLKAAISFSHLTP